MSALPLLRPKRAPARSDRPNLRVVTEPRRRHTLTFVLSFLVAGAALVFGAVTLNALAASDAVTARELERTVVDAERHYAQLVAEVAALADPGRIRQVAQDELGMVRADGVRHLVLHRNLPADGYVAEAMRVGTTTDPVKPVLTAGP